MNDKWNPLDEEYLLESIEKGDQFKSIRKKTLIVFGLVVFQSLLIDLLYHFSVKDIPDSKLISQIVRLVLTIALLGLIYYGNNIARNIMTLLFSIGLIVSIQGLISMGFQIGHTSGRIMLAMTLVGGYTLYFINFDREFIQFFKSQKGK